MRHVFYCDTVGWIGSVGLTALRLLVGVAFVLHGWPKIQSPLGWMGPEASVPAIFQALAAVAASSPDLPPQAARACGP